MNKVFRSMTLAIGLSIAANAHAEMLRVGAALPALRLSDQHGVEATIGADDKIVMFSRDMDGGNIVKAALAEHGGSMLATAKAVYVANIAAMPSVITNLFALPSMRKRDYRILLDRDGEATADFPSKESNVTVMKLEGGTIAHIEFVASTDALLAMLRPQ